ncbi:MAG: proton-conducting transporter membrane subunit, partial [Planctomycetota bacterium]
MSEPLSWLWLIPALPLLGSVALGTLHFITLRARKEDPEATGTGRWAAVVAVAAVALSCAVAVLGFLRILPGSGVEALTSTSWDWIHVGGGLRVEVALVLDRLSGAMALVVTGVGLLIHIYAAGYMKGDPGYAKFFAYLNLFVAAMLMLILSGNLVGMFVGWEGVGLCSYLLIGFWYTKGAEKGWPAQSAQKAFDVNRIGDACFLIGSFLMIQLIGTLDL